MKPERDPPLIVASAVAVVSFAAILIRLCSAPTSVIAAYRLGLSAVILLPVYLKHGRSGKVKRREFSLCMLAGLFLSIHFLSWIESLKFTSVASSVVLVTTSPIFAAVFARLVIGEGIGRRTVVAIALCLVGSFAIGWGGLELGRDVLKGNILAVVGAAAFGAYFVTGRIVRKRVGFLEYVFLAYACSGVMLVAWAGLRGDPFVGFDSINYLWFLLLAIGPQVYGHSALNWALRYLPAHKIAISILGEPIGSSLLAWLFFSEVPGYSLLVGAVLILYGVYLALTAGGRS